MTVHTDFWELFSMATQVRPLIFANQNAPKPPKPFASVQLISANALPAHYGYIDVDGNRPIYEHMPLSANLQFYGDQSWENAQTFGLMMNSEAVRSKAESLNIGINSIGNMQDAPALLDGSFYEPRTIITVDVSYTCTVEEWVSWIETVEFTYQIPNRADRQFTATINY